MKKIPLLLLPDLLCDKTVWQHQIRDLSPFADIIVPDLSKADSPEKMVKAVLDVAPPQFALAGHSMGGWVALEIMKQAPNRVLKLCLIDTTANPDTIEKANMRKKMIALAEQGNYEAIISASLKKLVYRQDCINDIKKMFEKNKMSLIPQEKAMLQRDDCISILKNIHCDTLIIHSNQDDNFHLSDSQLLADKIPHATLKTINDCGHMSPMEAPDKVTDLMKEWLSR